MKKLISMVIFATLTFGAMSSAFAQNEQQNTEIERNNPPSVIVDENYNIDRQDFLNPDNVSDVKITFVDYDGNKTDFQFKSGLPFLDEDHRIRLPLRDFAEQLGYDVTWYAKTGQVVVSKGEEWYTFTPENKIIICWHHMKTRHIMMDTTTQLVNGVTYIPLRHIATILSQNVIWNEDDLSCELYNVSVIGYDNGPVYIDSRLDDPDENLVEYTGEEAVDKMKELVEQMQ